MPARLALGVALATIAGLAASHILFPYDLGHFEAGTWEPGRILLSGHNPYAYPLTTAPPYVMAPYGPLYYALVGVGLRLFGPQLWFGRLIAAAAMVAVAGLLHALARRFCSHPAAGALAAIAFLAQPAVQFWTAAHRPDALALALGFAGIAIATAPRHSARAPIVSAVCVASAILTRQTFVLPPLVIAAWYLATGQRRQALTFAAVTALILGVVLVVFEATSAGGFLWQQFVLPSQVPLGFGQLRAGLATLAAAPATWIVAALAVGGLLSSSNDVAPSRDAAIGRRLVVGYAALAIVLALVTSARAGSNVNYWLEASATLALATAVLAERLLATPRAWHNALFALALAAMLGASPLVGAERARWHTRPYLDAIVRRLRDASPPAAPILSIYPELAAYAGREPWFGDSIQYDGRSPAHRELLIATMHSGAFAAIVLPFDHAPEGYHRTPALEPPTDAPVFLFTRP